MQGRNIANFKVENTVQGLYHKTFYGHNKFRNSQS